MIRTLVFGAPGAGKTTWARNNLGAGLMYDMDLIAAALTGGWGDKTANEDAREVANDLLIPVINAARWCYTDLTVIRAAPTVEEIQALQPDLIVWIRSEPAEARIRNWTSKRLLPTAEMIRMMGYIVEEVTGRV